jgi:Ser/Thr protein kinase RdoA (MazF antagonist)
MSDAHEDLDVTAQNVWRRYDVAEQEPLLRLGNSSGFSGARFWRSHGRTKDLLLRAWPSGMDADRLSNIHGLQEQAHLGGLSFVPDILLDKYGQSFVQVEGRLWQVESWMTGDCDRNGPSPKRVNTACKALAQLHLAWPKAAAGPCPAIQRRLQVMAEWNEFVRRQNGLFPAQTTLPNALVSAAHETLQKGLPKLPELLRLRKDKEWQLQYCLCDIWRPHVLFVGDRVSGIIDYGSVKVDHVAGDLARLLGSWVADDQELWNAGLEAYGAVRPLSADERILAAVLDRSGTILSLATWLLWLWRDHRSFDAVAAASERLKWLVERARGLTPFPQSWCDVPVR